MPGIIDAIGAVITKATDYIQGRSERRRNEISKIKREMDEISKKDPTAYLSERYAKLSKRLRVLQENASNS
jgi:hypothetical protein